MFVSISRKDMKYMAYLCQFGRWCRHWPHPVQSRQCISKLGQSLGLLWSSEQTVISWDNK